MKKKLAGLDLMLASLLVLCFRNMFYPGINVPRGHQLFTIISYVVFSCGLRMLLGWEKK